MEYVAADHLADNSCEDSCEKSTGSPKDEVSEQNNTTQVPGTSNYPNDQVSTSESPHMTDTSPDYKVGRVISYHARKGYGFLVDINTNQRFFVHHSSIKPSLPAIFDGWKNALYTGEFVSFVVKENPQRPGSLCATNITGIRNKKGEAQPLICDSGAWRNICYRTRQQRPQAQVQKRKPKRKTTIADIDAFVPEFDHFF